MDINEIKKSLYKENPPAEFRWIRMEVAYYSTHIKSNNQMVNFEIPVMDMGNADFSRTMDSKHLIRWIVDSKKESLV